jgi:hypothetical protein
MGHGLSELDTLFKIFEGMVSEHTDEAPRVCATFVIKLAI